MLGIISKARIKTLIGAALTLAAVALLLQAARMSISGIPDAEAACPDFGVTCLTPVPAGGILFAPQPRRAPGAAGAAAAAVAAGRQAELRATAVAAAARQAQTQALPVLPVSPLPIISAPNTGDGGLLGAGSSENSFFPAILAAVAILGLGGVSILRLTRR